MKEISLIVFSTVMIFALSSCGSSDDEPAPPTQKYEYGDRVENVWDPAYGFIPDDYAYCETPEEKFEKLRLPEEFLTSLSTMDLLRVCLTFPYIYDFVFADNVDSMSGMVAYKIDCFHGFEFLRQREDAFDCMLDYYEGLIDEINETRGEHDFSVFQLPLCEFYICSGHLRAIEDLPAIERLEQLANRATEIRNNYEQYQGCVSMCGLRKILTVCGIDFDFGPSPHW